MKRLFKYTLLISLITGGTGCYDRDDTGYNDNTGTGTTYSSANPNTGTTNDMNGNTAR
jgi:hypothetical protein